MIMNKTGFDRAIMPGIVLVLLFGLLTACAQPHRVRIKPPGSLPEVKEKTKGPLSSIPDLRLNDFQLKILTEKHGICPGPDGNDMIFLGRGARLQLILRFSQTPSVDIRAGDLVARLADLSFPFARRTAEKTYMTDIIDLNSLKHGISTGPSGVSIFYKDRDEDIFLGAKGMLAIDTSPPPKPLSLYVTDTGPDYFSLTWESGKGEIKEYSVQKWDSGQWRTFRSGFSSPPVRIDSKPAGRVRVMVIDCALNRAFSEEVTLGSTRAGNKAKVFKTQKRDGIMVDANGPGSDILSDYFKGECATRGFISYKQTDNPNVEPIYQITMSVNPGKPQLVDVYGLYCWHVEAAIKLIERPSGKKIHLSLRDIDGMDVRIYGKSLRQALRGQGPNSFPEKIGKPFIKEFLDRFDRFLHTR